MALRGRGARLASHPRRAQVQLGEYVESGNADIRYAIKYQTELRRRYCCCCVIVLVVVAVVLIYLAVTNPRLFKKIK